MARRKHVGGEEVDAFSRASNRGWPAGKRKAVKVRANRRDRRAGKQHDYA